FPAVAPPSATACTASHRAAAITHRRLVCLAMKENDPFGKDYAGDAAVRRNSSTIATTYQSTVTVSRNFFLIIYLTYQTRFAIRESRSYRNVRSDRTHL